jgi:molybdopterin synthase sulfur carrier subunit
MAVVMYLPAYLQPFAGGRSEVEVNGGSATLREALDELRRDYPGVYERVMTERGEVRQHVNVFIGEESIRDAQGLASPIPDGTEITILPAVSGG